MNQDIMSLEYIGRWISLKNTGVKGRVIDETKNSFLIKTKKNAKRRLLKQNSIFQMEFDNNYVDISGNSILMKPEDRIKNAE